MTCHTCVAGMSISLSDGPRPMNAKEHALLDRSVRFEAQLQIQIAKDAGAIYCRHTGYCTDWVQETK